MMTSQLCAFFFGLVSAASSNTLVLFALFTHSPNSSSFVLDTLRVFDGRWLYHLELVCE